MTLREYKNDYCSRCKKCDGSEYHQYHCCDTDIIEETWEACQQHMTDKACEWLKDRLLNYDSVIKFKEAMEE